MRDSIVPRSSRRAFLSAAVGALALASLSPLAARAGDANDQAEWPQSYETSPQMAVGREATPILSPATVDATQAAIQKFHGYAIEGRNLTVNEARPKEERPPRQFEGGERRGGFGGGHRGDRGERRGGDRGFRR